jgi:hypothetical protein
MRMYGISRYRIYISEADPLNEKIKSVK